MSGAKATTEEKNEIRQLFTDGYSIQEVQSRFPHVDGRVISGVHRKMAQSSKEASGKASPLPTDSPGIKKSQGEEAEDLGFTPEQQTTALPTGFKNHWREYFVIKRLDGDNRGVLGEEYPPFNITNFSTQYPPGDYEIQHFKDGRLVATYREKIANRGQNGGIQFVQEKAAQNDPANTIMKAMDTYHRIHSDARREVDAERASTRSADTAKEMAKARVEQTATEGLIGVIREQNKRPEPAPDRNQTTVNDLMVIMEKQREGAESRHKMDMESMQKKYENEMKLEKVRLENEQQRFKEDLNHRESMQKTFLTEMQGLRSKEQDLFKENYDRMIGEISETRNAVHEELQRSREHANELADVQRKHTDEVIELKKLTGGKENDIKVAEIIKDGLVGGLDRIGHRVDLILDGPNKEQNGNGNVGAGQVRISPPKKKGDVQSGQEDATVLSQDQIKDDINQPWFDDLKEEVFRTLKRRSEGRKIHGSLLGQVFLDNVNSDKAKIAHLHWLYIRTWKEVLEKVDEKLLDEERDVFKTEAAEVWFEEFQDFLAESWNESQKQMKAMRRAQAGV